MCLLQCLVTLEGHYIVVWAILKVVCPTKVNESYIVRALTKAYIFQKRPFSPKGYFDKL